MKVRWWIAGGLVVLAVVGPWGGRRGVQAWQEEAKPRRAAAPEFDEDAATRVFFRDVFSRLVGTRPERLDEDPLVDRAPPDDPSDGGRPESGSGWSQWVSAETLEDEIKAINNRLKAEVTTPSVFAGRGHRPARREFALLAVMFAVINEYDGTVRWAEDSHAGRYLFARVAANLKAGGAIQVYNESVARRDDLDGLIRGEQMAADGVPEEVGWEVFSERPPLMQLLETRFEANLRTWTNSDAEFNSHSEELLHEAELATMIARALMKKGMEYSEDAEYQEFAQQLAGGAEGVAAAVRLGDPEAARQAVSEMSRSCVACHDLYQ